MRQRKEPIPEIVVYKVMWELARDMLLFLAGVAGIFYELIHGPVNSSLLIVFAGMLGFPITLSHTVSRTEK